MKKIYERVDNNWNFVSYGCQHCKKTFKREYMCTLHEDVCKNINTIKEEYYYASTKDHKNGKN